MKMYYNWEFILKAREGDQKTTGVIVGDYELIIRVMKGQVPIPPYIDVCNSFDGVSDEEVLSAKLTLVENVFLEYALFLVVGRVGQEKAYRDLRHKLKPIANDYVMRLEAVGKRRVGRDYSWDLWSGGKDIYRPGVSLMKLEVTDNAEFVLSVKDKCSTADGEVRWSAVVPVEHTKLRPSLPTIVKRFYETMRWPESNPRYLAASELLLDEIDRAEKRVHESLFALVISREELATKLFDDPLQFTVQPRGSWMKIDESAQYNYLVVFQDLMAPQSTVLGADWVGSFEIRPLYNVAVYRSPSENFSLMFTVDGNVRVDAVEAGAKGTGLAAQLSKLAVARLGHTTLEWRETTKLLRACFE